MKTQLPTIFFPLILSVIAASAQPSGVIINPATGLPGDGSSPPRINPTTGLPDDGSPPQKIDPATGLLGPDAALQKGLEKAEEAMSQGQYDDAFTNLISYFDQAQFGDGFQKVNRLGAGLSLWVELGRRYPEARQALVEKKADDTQKFLHGGGYFDLFMELNAINQHLGDDDATLTVFKSIEDHDPQLAGQCYLVVESQLVQKGEYQTCLKYLGDPESRFQIDRSAYQNDVQNQIKRAAMFQQTEQMTSEIRRQHGWTNVPAYSPPDFSARMKKLNEDRFVSQVRQLIEILVATGSKSDAEKIQHEAFAVLDDPRLERAVDNAQKAAKQNSTQN